jgi:hypothetical protein
VLEEVEVEREGYTAPWGRCARPHLNKGGSKLGTVAYGLGRSGTRPGVRGAGAAASAAGLLGEGRDYNDVDPSAITGE